MLPAFAFLSSSVVSLTASFGNSAQQFSFAPGTAFVHFVIRCDLCDHILSRKKYTKNTTHFLINKFNNEKISKI